MDDNKTFLIGLAILGFILFICLMGVNNQLFFQ